MAADDEPLSTYLDRMIEAAYVVTERGVGRTFHNPDEEDVTELIEDDELGRPVPIEDSADHFLLLSFDRFRREYWSRPPIPDWNYDVNGTVILSGNRKFDCTEIHGEIPWRTMHLTKE